MQAVAARFSGNYSRVRPVAFNQRSLLGEMSCTGFADWPISCEELDFPVE